MSTASTLLASSSRGAATSLRAQQQRNSNLVVAAAAEPRREMSLQQRIRAFKFAVEEKKKELATSPPISILLAAIAAVRAALQPLFEFLSKLQQQWEAVSEAYNQFLAEETKSKWTWSKRNKKELALLAAFPPYTLALALTLIFQAFTPVSFLCCFILPWYYSWAVWDTWWLSPVFVGTILMAPLKFAPWGWAYFWWVWPGLV